MASYPVIIGNGLVASAFSRSKLNFGDTTIFASGVSDSSCCDDSAFARESLLLRFCLDQCNSDHFFLYFSTCSIYDPLLVNSQYVLHKLAMEEIVLSSQTGRVIRLPQLIGLGASGKTLVPYLVSCIKSQRSFHVWSKAYRNILNIDHLVRIVFELLLKELRDIRLHNIACSYNISIFDLVRIIENELQTKALYSIRDAGSNYMINIESVADAVMRSNIIFDSDYYRHTISSFISSLD